MNNVGESTGQVSSATISRIWVCLQRKMSCTEIKEEYYLKMQLKQNNVTMFTQIIERNMKRFTFLLTNEFTLLFLIEFLLNAQRAISSWWNITELSINIYIDSRNPRKFLMIVYLIINNKFQGSIQSQYSDFPNK